MDIKDDVEAVCEVVDEKYNRVRFYRQTGDSTKPYHRPGEKLYDEASVNHLTTELIKARELLGEPVSIGTLYRDCDERIVFEPSREIHVKDGMEVFSRPQRLCVLPERKAVRWDIPEGVARAEEWNACLDEFERLNK